MKGTIQIFNNENLVYESNNLLVDGAGETVVDMLTTSPSLSAIVSASALLDTSNYTIQGISFSKGKYGYLNNAHAWDSSAPYPAGNTKEAYYSVCGTSTGAKNKGVAVVFAPGSLPNGMDGIVTSSLNVKAKLSDPPTPMDTILERGVQLSGGAFTDTDSAIYSEAYNEELLSQGQNLNYLPYLNNVGFAVESEGLASYVGCYPEGSSTGGTDYYVVSSLESIIATHSDLADIPYLSATVSGNLTGVVNEASSMDIRGIIGKVYDQNGKVGTAAAALNQSWLTSGLVVSSFNASDLGRVYYCTTLGADDLACAHLYGGIYGMGLWTINNKETSGMQAPYSWDVSSIPRRQYRLFSKHTSSRDLTFVSDRGSNAGLESYSDMRVIWRLDF